MHDPKIDQAFATMRDIIPQSWWAYYTGSIAAGFTPIQAFALLQTHILSQNPHGIAPKLPPDVPNEGEPGV